VILSAALWTAVRDVGGQELVSNVLKRSAAEVARRYQSCITAPTVESRVHQMASLLRTRGQIVEVSRRVDGLIVLRSRTCPFVDVLDEARLTCRSSVLAMSA